MANGLGSFKWGSRSRSRGPGSKYTPIFPTISTKMEQTHFMLSFYVYFVQEVIG
eukprot:TRINITY_DN4337_c0_g1_i1.p4 TRINITY_DN4337_c0_g1~~TRINITY_DN4337_c0_g1_i1.p4  ORF type:complete len:54 (-),score=3.58 TRINITY_DN4337_c0_g1_i1:173-334(-)